MYENASLKRVHRKLKEDTIRILKIYMNIENNRFLHQIKHGMCFNWQHTEYFKGSGKKKKSITNYGGLKSQITVPE